MSTHEKKTAPAITRGQVLAYYEQKGQGYGVFGAIFERERAPQAAWIDFLGRPQGEITKTGPAVDADEARDKFFAGYSAGYEDVIQRQRAEGADQ